MTVLVPRDKRLHGPCLGALRPAAFQLLHWLDLMSARSKAYSRSNSAGNCHRFELAEPAHLCRAMELPRPYLPNSIWAGSANEPHRL
jgi:hypothetical protein